MKKFMDFIEMVCGAIMVVAVIFCATVIYSGVKATEPYRAENQEFHEEFSTILDDWYGHGGRAAVRAFERHEGISGEYKTLTHTYTLTNVDEPTLAELMSEHPVGKLYVEDSEFSVSQILWQIGL